MVTTFGGITLAKLGIRASQQALQTTGNNIANINTSGYTRQRVNQISLRAGSTDRYAVSSDVRMGTGTLVVDVTQIRDPYLDIRYRNEMASVGYYDEKLKGLEELQSAIDEVSHDGIHTAIESLRTSLKDYVNDSISNANDDTIRAKAQSLVSLLNSYSAELKTQKENAIDNFDQNVDSINKILTNIRDLNVEIRKSNIHGDNALEMVDQRNMLIDELAEYTKIRVTYTDEYITDTLKVPHLTIELDAPDRGPDHRHVLVDGQYANQLEIRETDADGNIDKNAESYNVNLTGLTDLYGDSPLINALQEQVGTLNQLVQNISKTNDKLTAFNDKLTEWQNAVTAAGHTLNDFLDDTAIENRRAALQQVIDDTYKAYKEATDPAVKAAAKATWIEAKDNYTNFDSFIAQKAALDRQQAGLEKDRDGQLANLEKALGEQGLTLGTIIDPATGTAALTADGAAGTFDLLDAAGNINIFSLEGPGADGSYDITIDNTSIRNVTSTEINADANKLELAEGDLYGALQANRDHLNGQGTFEPAGATDIRGIPYYQKTLDLLAKTFAETFNDINQKLATDANGNYIPFTAVFNAAGDDHEYETVNGDQHYKLAQPGYTVGVNDGLLYKDGVKVSDTKYAFNNGKLVNAETGKTAYQLEEANLFETSDGSDPITASNITISKDWRDGIVSVTKSIDPAGGTEDTTNLSNFIAATNRDISFDFVAGGENRTLFTGTFEEMFTNMDSTLGLDVNTSNTLLNNYSTAATERAVSRENVSSVDLNEEGINMIQFQKSFAASCRLMTTIDSIIDSVLNMGVTK